MTKLLIALGFLWAINADAGAQMQSAQFGSLPLGVVVKGGKAGLIEKKWVNPTGNAISVWGVQADIWTDMFIPPGNSMDALYGPGASIRHYFQSIADMGISIQRTSDHMVLLNKGSDHYDNAPSLNLGPTWFPFPFAVNAGDGLSMVAFAKNGWQVEFDSQFIFNTGVIVYFTQP